VQLSKSTSGHADRIEECDGQQSQTDKDNLEAKLSAQRDEHTTPTLTHRLTGSRSLPQTVSTLVSHHMPVLTGCTRSLRKACTARCPC
jgi:hypothetical protein